MELKGLLALVSLMATVYSATSEQAAKLPTGLDVQADTDQNKAGKCGIRPYDIASIQSQGHEPRSPLTNIPKDDVMGSMDAPSVMGKIIGGGYAGYGQYPWQGKIDEVLVVRTPYHTQIKNHQCGAVIINEYWLLSAAHCFTVHPPDDPEKDVQLDKYDITVTVGDYRVSAKDEGEQEFAVDKIIVHELYDSATLDNDIALLKIQPLDNNSGIIFSYFVQPACLPDSTTPYTVGSRCLISGWGLAQEDNEKIPDELKASEVPIVSQQLCKNLYWNYTITERMFCAGYITGGTDTCQGDSGGPLVCKSEGVYTLFGIVSFGEYCARPYFPGVYTRVSAFLPWIKSKMKLHQ